MIHSLFRSIRLLSDQQRSPQEEAARVEFLRVAINISWAGFALSLGLAIFWGMFAGPLKSWVDGMFPLLLVGYACWKLYFIRRATRIVAHNDAMKTKSRRK